MTDRKPSGVSWESWTDRLIEEGRRSGAFEGLSGSGKPIEGLDGPRDEDWWVKAKLRREQIDALPPTIAIRHQREVALADALAAADEEQARAIIETMNERIRHVNSHTVSGPPSTVWVIDVDDVIDRWRAGHPEPMDPFPLGVASFDPSPEAVVLWSWVPPGVHTVGWEMARDATFTDTVCSGEVAAPAGAIVVDVDGLDPDTGYYFRFRAGGAVVVGRTRTLPAARDGIRIGFASCSRQPGPGFQAYGHLADREPDLLVHLGDYIYERSEEPPESCRTLDEYRTRYRQYRHDPSLQRLHALTPWITVWDDHEIADGSWRRGTSHDLDDPTAFAQRRRAAQEAYDEFLPHRVDDWGPTHLDRHVRAGDLLDLVVLDARNAGREEPVRPSGGPALVRDDDDRRILTDDQWAWLEACVADVRGWLVLATQTQVSPLRLARLPNPRRRFRVDPLVNAGQWDGYPAERRRLASLLEPVADRTLIVSGDLHGRFWSALTTPGGRPIRELTIPSISSVPFAAAVRATVPVMPHWLLHRWLGWMNPHIESMDLISHGAATIDVTHDAIVIEVFDRTGIPSFHTSLTRRPA